MCVVNRLSSKVVQSESMAAMVRLRMRLVLRFGGTCLGPKTSMCTSPNVAMLRGWPDDTLRLW